MKIFKALSIAVLAVLSCCTRPDMIPSLGKKHSDCFRRHGSAPGGSGEDSGTGGKFIPKAAPDTTLYFTTVSFPPDYDWQRDSAWGAVSFRLTLYRDYEPVLSILSDTCRFIRSDPDLHYIIDGHLYTECSLDGATVIGRDGQEVLRLPGKELLRGLRLTDDGLYTLSQRRDEGGFVLRKDGQVVFTKSSGCVFGDMNDPSYGPGGALYTDRGRLTFCFRDSDSAGARYYTYVSGGDAESAGWTGGSVEDLKSVNGRAIAATGRIGSTTIEDGRILRSGVAKTIIAGWMDGSFTGTVFEDGGGLRMISPVRAAVYSSKMAVSDEGGIIALWRDGDAVQRSDSPCFFFPGCLSTAGDDYALGLTPRGRGSGPYITGRSGTTAVDVYGYIGKVSLKVSHSNLEPEILPEQR